ncbi:unnamed protein product [Adineta ricciae]|uniref:Reverse transcriptase domain-containing protein n=1 Tax=Adineta ricciae TaxID=249248 RepID=A0A816E008_ADIRI|nr:unnamed protein product [Adineta ricciae]
MNNVFKTNDKLVRFKSVNGCGINISWLHSLLKHARLNKNSIYVSLVDVSKAFNSVSHQSIVRLLTQNGAPSMLIDLIVDQYNNVSTVINCAGEISGRIDISSGAKQAGPLSSLLFNLVIDELFDVIQDQYGYVIDGIGSTNARCFADNLTLVSSSRIGLNKLISLTTKERELDVNPSKCITIGMNKGYKGKKSKIETESIFSINDNMIPMLGYNNKTTRYLGVDFTSIGVVDVQKVKGKISDALDKLERLKLKAQCKLDILRLYVIPRFIFQLIHTDLYPDFLTKIDIQVGKMVKRILHLSMSTRNDFLYLPIREGGLQLMNIRETVSLSKIKLYKKITSGDDPVLRYLVQTQKSRIIDHFMINLNLEQSISLNDVNQVKDKLVKDKQNSFVQKIHGVGF